MRWSWMVLLVACGGKEGADSALMDTEPTEDPPATDTYTPPPTSTYADSPIADPPTDVTADCWSWTVTARADTNELMGLELATYDPTTLETLTYQSDHEPDGHWDYVLAYTWDAAFEEVLHYEQDNDGDGDPDRIVEQVFDAVTGHRLEYHEDTDGDGDFDRNWTYVWDGDLLLEAQADETGDAQPDTWWKYTYDDQGRPIRNDGDDGNDGTIEAQHVYVHDEVLEGRSYTQTFDADMDGVVEDTWWYTYDGLDQRTHYEYANSVGDHFIYDYTYTPDGDVATYASDSTFEGEWNDSQLGTYTYLAPKKLSTLTIEVDFTGEGDPDVTYGDEVTWSCP